LSSRASWIQEARMRRRTSCSNQGWAITWGEVGAGERKAAGGQSRLGVGRCRGPPYKHTCQPRQCNAGTTGALVFPFIHPSAVTIWLCTAHAWSSPVQPNPAAAVALT
jgi:hypothetical protein